MSVKCHNCGHENDALNARFCEACGSRLIDDQERNYEYDFGAQQDQNAPQNYSSPNGYNQPYMNNMGYPFASAPIQTIQTKIESRKLNKMKKELFSWSIFLIVISTLRFIFMLASLEDVNYIDDMLPTLPSEYVSAFSNYVNIAYAEYVILALFFAVSIALIVFTARMNKIQFPVQNDDIFQMGNKAFICSVISLCACSVYLVLEIAAVVVATDLETILGEEVINFTTIVSALVMAVLLVVGSALSTVYARKVAKSKQA